MMNVDNKGYEQYREQSVSTMSQGELLLLLYDELVKHLARCDLALSQGNEALFEASANRSIDILRYLDQTLNVQYAISHDLHKLYDFFLYELQRIKAGRNQSELAKIRPMIEQLRESFRQAEKQSAKEAMEEHETERHGRDRAEEKTAVSASDGFFGNHRAAGSGA